MAGVVVLLIILITIGGLFAFSYLRYRGVLRYAKGVERGLKMVPLLIHLPPSSDDTEVGTRDVRDVLMEKVSQAEVLYNIIASTAQKGFKSNFYGQRHFAFELISVNGKIQFYAAVPIALLDVVKQAIISSYPTAQLQEVEEHNIFNEVGKISGTIGGEIVLKESYCYPIATIQQSKRDAMQSLINSLSSLTEGDGAAVQILLRPATPGWEKNSKSLVEKIKKNKGKSSSAKMTMKGIGEALWKPPVVEEVKPEDRQLSNLEQSQVEAIEEKTKHPAYEVLIRVVASSNTSNKSQSVLRNIVSSFSLFDSPGLNGFSYNEARDIENFVTAFIFRFFPPEINTNILNSVELATLFHFPDQQFTHSSQLERQAAKQVDGPNILPDTGLLLGYNLFRGVKKEIRLSPDDRRRHVYIVGQTGTGKSTLLENIILQDMVEGNGLAFVDPHGDTAERLLSMVPRDRAEDVIYFDPGNMDSPMGLNLFEFQTDYQKDFLIQEAINMLYKLYDPQRQGIIGPRYEHWFRNAALTLMADPKGATFIEIPKIFTDKQFVKEKLKYVKDPTVLDFWNKEMAQTSDYHKSEVLGWFVSKFGAFMSNEMMRNIIGQVKGSFDLRRVMDEKKILIVNLSKGRVGELNSKLLGMIFVMKFQAAAMSRADVPEDQRVDFSLYVDEFQNFSTDSFATILSEARKYRLNLIVANQFIGQLTEEIRDAVFGNVGTIIALRAGATDADFLVKQFSPVFDTQDIIKIPNYNAVTRLMIGGVPSQPFSMNTLPPFGRANPELGVALKQLSSVKYGRPRKEVETEIFKRIESKPLPKRPPLSAGRASGGGLPAAGSARKPGGSSFLDDWLAKKRKEGQQKSVPSTSSNLPSNPPTTQINQPTAVAPQTNSAVSPGNATPKAAYQPVATPTNTDNTAPNVTGVQHNIVSSVDKPVTSAEPITADSKPEAIVQTKPQTQNPVAQKATEPSDTDNAATDNYPAIHPVAKPNSSTPKTSSPQNNSHATQKPLPPQEISQKPNQRSGKIKMHSPMVGGFEGSHDQSQELTDSGMTESQMAPGSRAVNAPSVAHGQERTLAMDQEPSVDATLKHSHLRIEPEHDLKTPPPSVLAEMVTSSKQHLSNSIPSVEPTNNQMPQNQTVEPSSNLEQLAREKIKNTEDPDAIHPVGTGNDSQVINPGATDPNSVQEQSSSTQADLSDIKGDVTYSSSIDGFSADLLEDEENAKNVSKISIDKDGKIHTAQESPDVEDEKAS